MDSQVRLNITKREPFADGMDFGDVGPYERIAGQVDFAIDPDDPANESIVDLKLTPRNSAGLVEYSTDFYILKPVDIARGNRRLIYDVNNRGNKRIIQYFNDGVHSNDPSSKDHAGNGFLMRRGYSVIWSGWQGDCLPGEGRLTMRLPIATEDGEEITGDLRTEFIVDDAGVTCLPLSATNYSKSYEVTDTDTASAVFTYREYPYDEKIAISPDEWQFAALDDDGNPNPSATHCYRPSGFKPGWIYDLIYTAKNPMVMGLGFTGLRDLISFLMHAEQDAEGIPNPLREGDTGMEKAYVWGRSQSGRPQKLIGTGRVLHRLLHTQACRHRQRQSPPHLRREQSRQQTYHPVLQRRRSQQRPLQQRPRWQRLPDAARLLRHLVGLARRLPPR